MFSASDDETDLRSQEVGDHHGQTADAIINCFAEKEPLRTLMNGGGERRHFGIFGNILHQFDWLGEEGQQPQQHSVRRVLVVGM